MYRVQVKVYAIGWASVVGLKETLEAAQELAANYSEARVINDETGEIVISPERFIS